MNMASNGRMMMLLALLLVVGAVGVIFYSVEHWRATLSQSITPAPVAVNASALPPTDTQPSVPLSSLFQNSPTGVPAGSSPSSPSAAPDAKQLRAQLLSAGVDAQLLSQVSDQQLVEFYQQFAQQKASAGP